jgi:hypothetical protein
VVCSRTKAVNRQIGRPMQRNQRAAARFVVTLPADQSPAGFLIDDVPQRDVIVMGTVVAAPADMQANFRTLFRA